MICQVTPGGCFLSVIEGIEPLWNSNSLQNISKDDYNKVLEMLKEETQIYPGIDGNSLTLTEVSFGMLKLGEHIHFFYLK